MDIGSPQTKRWNMNPLKSKISHDNSKGYTKVCVETRKSIRIDVSPVESQIKKLVKGVNEHNVKYWDKCSMESYGRWIAKRDI